MTMWRPFILLLCLTLSLSAMASNEGIEIIIVRDQNKLLVNKDNRTIKTFYAALGSGGKQAKLREGDKRTPKGHYRIVEVISFICLCN